MKPKRITRTTTPITTTNKENAFVGIVDGNVSLVDLGSGFEDESMITGEVDVDALREMGLSDDDIAKAQEALDERINEKLFGDSTRAYTPE